MRLNEPGEDLGFAFGGGRSSTVAGKAWSRPGRAASGRQKLGSAPVTAHEGPREAQKRPMGVLHRERRGRQHNAVHGGCGRKGAQG